MRRPPFLDQGGFCADTGRKVQSRILCPWPGLGHTHMPGRGRDIGVAHEFLPSNSRLRGLVLWQTWTWAYRPPVNNQDMETGLMWYSRFIARFAGWASYRQSL